MPVVACLTGRAGHDVILDAPRELADISDQPRLSGSVRYFRAVTAAAIGGQAIQYVASCCVSPTACRDADQRQIVALLILPWVIFGLAGWVCGRRG